MEKDEKSTGNNVQSPQKMPPRKTKPDKPTKNRSPRSMAALDKARLLAACTAMSAALAVGAVVYAAVSVSGVSGELARYEADATSVVVAAKDIAVGSVVEEGSVVLADVPKTFVPAGSATDLASVVGKIATANIDEGAQVSANNLSGEGNTSVLAQAISQDMVAASISVDPETGVAGLLRQGDHVDILAEGQPIVENARVLALDNALSGAVEQYSTVTVEVSSEQAGLIQTAQTDGTVRLVLDFDTGTGEGGEQA